MVEHAAVNRVVVGSSPTSGAKFDLIFWVYILQNPAGRFYIGRTDDLPIRLESHNRTDKADGKFTRKNGPWVLALSESHPNSSLRIQLFLVGRRRLRALIRERRVEAEEFGGPAKAFQTPAGLFEDGQEVVAF